MAVRNRKNPFSRMKNDQLHAYGTEHYPGLTPDQVRETNIDFYSILLDRHQLTKASYLNQGPVGYREGITIKKAEALREKRRYREYKEQCRARDEKSLDFSTWKELQR